jgi:two-component system alkaline phosphatase synthesis response regulator PhoP
MSTPNPKTALVVEDDIHIAELLKFILEREGFAVTLAHNGKTAVAAMTPGQPMALALFDLMLPFMNGDELIKHARATPGWADVPIIMLTAQSQESNIVKALEGGANDYMVKPFQPAELRARIKRLVKS